MLQQQDTWQVQALSVEAAERDLDQRLVRPQEKKQTAHTERDQLRQERDKLRNERNRLQAKVNSLER